MEFMTDLARRLTADLEINSNKPGSHPRVNLFVACFAPVSCEPVLIQCRVLTTDCRQRTCQTCMPMWAPCVSNVDFSWVACSCKEYAQRLLNDSATRLTILQDEMRSARSERRHVGPRDATATPVVLEATPKLAPRPSAKRRWCWNDDPRYAESQRLATERIPRGRDVGADNL